MFYNGLVTKWMSLQLVHWTKSNLYPKRSDWVTDDLYFGAIAVWQQRADEFKASLWHREVEDKRASAYLKAIMDGEAAVIRRRVQNDDFDGMPELAEISSRLKLLKNRNGNGGALTSLYFVTVNVKSDVSIADLKRRVERYVNRSMVTSAEWVFEQRGSTELEAGKGLHAHMIVRQRGDTFDGKFKANTRSTFGPLVGIPDRHVFITPMKEEFLNDKRAYMQGAKTAEGKAEKCTVDVLWREQNNISAYYTISNGGIKAQGTTSVGTPQEEGSLCEDSSYSSSEHSGSETELLLGELDVQHDHDSGILEV